MFTLEIDGVKIEVAFRHGEGYVERDDWTGDRRFTLCEGTVQGLPITGISICHPGDQFEKAKGRKVAYTDFVRQVTKIKAFRAELWKAYFDAMGGPK